MRLFGFNKLIYLKFSIVREKKNEDFDYEDIQLIPNKCIVNSRSECDTSIKFGPRSFKLPVVPANMQTVMNEELAQWFAKMTISTLCIVSMRKHVFLSLKRCKMKGYLLQFLLA